MINFAFNCCWDSYRKWIVAHWIHRFHRSISGHSIFVVNSHNRVPTSLFAIATMRRNFVTTFHSASRPRLSWGGTMSTMLSWNQVDALSASYRKLPRLSESTSCHGKRQFLLRWQYDWFSLASRSISRMISSERPNSIIVFLKVLSRINRSWMLSYFFFATFPCKLIRRMVFFASRSFPILVTVWPALLFVKVRDGERIQHGRDVLLFFGSIIFHEMSTCTVRNSCTPMRKACFAL